MSVQKNHDRQQFRRPTRAAVMAAVAAASFAGQAASAGDTYKWTRGAGNNNWDGTNAGTFNWVDVTTGNTPANPPPDPLADISLAPDLLYTAATAPGTTGTVRKSYTINSLTFNSDFNTTGSFNISTLTTGTVAADITLGAGGMIAHDFLQNVNINHTSNAAISAKLTLSADQTWNIDIPPTPTGSGKTFGVFRPLYGSATLTKAGSGILILTKNNGNFTGNIVLNEGTIRTGGDASSPNTHLGIGTVINESANDVSITSSTVSNDDEGTPGGADRTFSNNFRLGGTGQMSFGGSFNIHLSNTSTITLTSDKRISTANNANNLYTWGAKITGPFGWTKQGGGTLTLTNNTSDYTGTTGITGGTLVVSDTHQLGDASATNNLLMNGTGTLRFTTAINTARTLTSGAGGTIDVGALDTTISGTMAAVGTGVLHKVGAGTLTLANLRAGGFAVDVGKVALIANGTDAGVGKVGSLSVAPAATLDLNDNDLIVNYDPTVTPVSPADGLRQLLKAGRDSAWAGPGIVSKAATTTANTAIGYAEASDVLNLAGTDTGTWGGQAVDASAVLMKYTYYGDANLDGKVTADDLALADRGLAKASTGWSNGDFNYDNTVDAADFALMDQAFAANGGPLSPELLAGREAQFGAAYVSGLVASVPEPTTLGLVVGGVLAAASHRRRK